MGSLIRNAGPAPASTDLEFDIVTPDGGRRCAMKARTAQLTQGEGDPAVLCIFDEVTERQERGLQSGERQAEATARPERQAFEMELVMARVDNERVQREYAAA